MDRIYGRTGGMWFDDSVIKGIEQKINEGLKYFTEKYKDKKVAEILLPVDTECKVEILGVKIENNKIVLKNCIWFVMEDKTTKKGESNNAETEVV